MEPEHLYSPTDVKKERKRLYDLQGGVDPILNSKIEFDQTVCDHSHITQNTRAAIHRQSNSFEGRVYNAYVRGLKWLTDVPLPDILRNLAEYLEKDYSNNPYHTGWLKAMQTKFNALSESQKKAVLKAMARPEGNNAKERKETFRKALLSRQFTMTQVIHLIENERK